ncbi:MAG: type II toxin-antitoxin system HicA family toxin [Gammaproteobacteria bacterium]|nr:type II toxin-antitoxin system HicA family toxin [Gammaproteobacteria bacterium]
MKCRALTRHLTAQGCRLLRQGSPHEWWVNVATNERSSVPRHGEITNVLANKICRDLGVARIDRS